MEAFEMWGPAASGARLVDFDRLKAAQQMGEIAMQPLKQEELRTQAEMQSAHARAFRAQAAEHEAKAAEEQQWQQLLKDKAGQLEQTTDGLEKMTQWFNLAAGAGLTKKTEELGKGITTMRNSLANEAAHLATAQDKLYSIQHRRMETLSNLMTDEKGGNAVTSPEALEAVKQAFSQSYPGQPNPLMGYNFEQLGGAAGLDKIRLEAISAKDRLAEQRRQEAQDNLATFRKNRVSQHDAELIQKKAADDERARHNAVMEKGGAGKAVGDPPKEAREQARRLLLADNPRLANPDEAAYSIASDAQARARALPGLSMDEAIRQAMLASKAKGELETSGGVTLPVIGKVGEKTQFKRGETKESGAALPAPVDPKERKVGMAYTSPNGGQAIWTGKGWLPHTPGKPFTVRVD